MQTRENETVEALHEHKNDTWDACWGGAWLGVEGRGGGVLMVYRCTAIGGTGRVCH